MKKITLATIKSFIKRNHGKLYIIIRSTFDRMIDCVSTNRDAKLEKAQHVEDDGNNLGIAGAWFVKQSRDYFTAYEDATHIGYEVYNCCGSFTLLIEKD